MSRIVNRPKYKALYHTERANFTKAAERARVAEAELKRLKHILASEGQRLLETEVNDGQEPIGLAPLPMECALAFIDSTQRMVYPGGEGYSIQYTWRGRPLILR